MSRMVVNMSEDGKTSPEAGKPAKRSRISQADIPAISLEKALRVPRAIADNYASHPTRPLDVASALDVQPSSGSFRVECGAAIGYGLTEGGPNAPEISLTTLGKRMVAPTEVDDDKVALREAAIKPTVANQFYTKYDGSPLPPKNIAQNVLATLSVPADRTSDVFDLLIENARYVGLLKTIKDKEYIDIGGPLNGLAAGPRSASATPEPAPDESGLVVGGEDVEEAQIQPPKPPATTEKKKRPNKLFVGHGRNKKPLDQLTKILRDLSIPYLVAEDEANVGRPISQKVRDTMDQCGAAILIFSADIEHFDKDGNSIWHSSENVSHELGASAVMYDDRVILFKEKDVNLASNFSGIGYIPFEKDRLDAEMSALLRELVALKFLKLSVGDDD